MRCGIALAGANHAGQITNAVAEDGLLTGLEASLLNLIMCASSIPVWIVVIQERLQQLLCRDKLVEQR